MVESREFFFHFLGSALWTTVISILFVFYSQRNFVRICWIEPQKHFENHTKVYFKTVPPHTKITSALEFFCTSQLPFSSLSLVSWRKNKNRKFPFCTILLVGHIITPQKLQVVTNLESIYKNHLPQFHVEIVFTN